MLILLYKIKVNGLYYFLAKHSKQTFLHVLNIFIIRLDLLKANTANMPNANNVVVDLL